VIVITAIVWKIVVVVVLVIAGAIVWLVGV